MSTLKEIQQTFFKSITASSLEVDNGVYVTANGASAKRRIGLYHHAYWQRLIRALRDDFPVTARLLGDNCFNDLATQYFASTPSSYTSIANIGVKFPDFILPLALEPHIKDMAKFERLLIETFYIDNDPPNDPSTYVAHDIALWVNPSLRLFKSDWPIDRIYESEQSHNPEPTCLLVYNRDHEAHYCKTSEFGHALLLHLAARVELESAILAAAQEHLQVPSAYEVKALFESWASLKVVWTPL